MSPKLSKTMTLRQFDNGYWYATELRAFADRIGIPSAGKLRKDELETAVKRFLRTGKAAVPTKRSLKKSGVKDLDRGLRLSLPVVHYTSNKQTKDFLMREVRKIEPGFKRKSGTRYLLNRWREEQITKGVRLTYRDLVHQIIKLNRTTKGPLRTSQGRYNNFYADFMAGEKKPTRAGVIRAWNEVKKMDAPKTYRSWKKLKRR